MRIRNSRPPFPIPSPPSIIPRGTYPSLLGDLCFKGFLVGRTNRCHQRKMHICQGIEKGQPDAELHRTTAKGKETLNCEDEKKEESHLKQEKPIPALEVSDGELANGGNESIPSAYQKENQGFGCAMNIVLALPAPSSELGKKFQYKHRRSRLLETQMAKVHGSEDVGKEDGSRTPRTNCVVNYQCVTPPVTDSPQGLGKPGDMAAGETSAEPRVKPRRGRKRKLNYQSDDSYKGTWHRRRSGRTKRAVVNSVNGNNRSGENQRPRRGRPKLKKLRKGRPRKEYNQSMIENGGKRKPKRRSPRNARAQSAIPFSSREQYECTEMKTSNSLREGARRLLDIDINQPEMETSNSLREGGRRMLDIHIDIDQPETKTSNGLSEGGRRMLDIDVNLPAEKTSNDQREGGRIMLDIDINLPASEFVDLEE